jgi:hypothetical protein
MSNGWHCEACGEFFAESIVHTKITVEMEPRDYAAAATYCSLACLDKERADPVLSDLVDRPENRGPRFARFTVVQEYVEEGWPGE